MMEAATSYMQIVGQVVRGRREMQGIALLSMAEAADLATVSGWSRVETGDTTMTLAQLRKAARLLNMDPWVLVQQADTIAAQLEASGMTVHDEKPKNVGKWLLGGAALLAVVAGAAAAASKKKTNQTEE
jgi:transcriptional regulator with XRE-family HTH domain